MRQYKLELMSNDDITEFKGTYRFLSNFYPCTITWEGLPYSCVEAAYQAAKCVDVEQRKEFVPMNGGMAKRAGKKVELRTDWEEVKLPIMLTLLRIKFEDIRLREMLLSTGETHIVEGNYWHDTFWGIDMYSGKGENHLGELLMAVRSEYGQLRRARNAHN